MDEAKNRVFEDKKELEDKLLKLTNFITINPRFKYLPKKMRSLLLKQQKYMYKYFLVLKERLKIWEEIKK